MAGRSDIEAGKAYVRLYVKQDTFLSQLGKIGPVATKWALGVGAAITGAFAAATAAVGMATKSFIEAGSELDDMSQRTGVAADILGSLKYAAEQSGTSMSALENGIRRMQRVIVDAANGSKSAADSLSMLGLSAQDLTGLNADEQIKLIADRISGIQDPTVKAAAAMEVFGRSGTELLPMLSAGAEGIQKLQDRARELGIVLSNEDAAAAAELGDRFDDLWLSIQAMAVQLGASLAPALTEVLSIVQEQITAGVKWLQGNKHLITQFTTELVPAIEKAIKAASSFARIIDWITRIEGVDWMTGNLTMRKGGGPPDGEVAGMLPSESVTGEQFGGTSPPAATPRSPIGTGDAEFDAFMAAEEQAFFDAMMRDFEAARDVAASVLTGQEKFDAYMAHLDDLFAKGLIDLETFSRAFDAARERFDVQMPEEPRKPGPGLTADKVPSWDTDGFHDSSSLRRSSVAGSFSAAGLVALGGGQQAIEKVAKNTEDIAKNTKESDRKTGELLDKIDAIGLEAIA